MKDICKRNDDIRFTIEIKTSNQFKEAKEVARFEIFTKKGSIKEAGTEKEIEFEIDGEADNFNKNFLFGTNHEKSNWMSWGYEVGKKTREIPLTLDNLVRVEKFLQANELCGECAPHIAKKIEEHRQKDAGAVNDAYARFDKAKIEVAARRTITAS